MLKASSSAFIAVASAARLVGLREDGLSSPCPRMHVGFGGMGLLDDAIREHLDLKRRRGADPTEIERAEREALGPVRRERGDEITAFDATHDPAEFDDLSSEAVEPFDSEADDSSMSVRTLESEERGADIYRLEAERDLDRAAADRPSEGTPSVANAPVQRGEAHREGLVDAPDGNAPASSDRPVADGETVEWDVERALLEESEGQEQDVLQETPDFLQDSPEHDRLWFEQRPPRDFDFNG